MRDKEITDKPSVPYSRIVKKTFQERFLAALILLVVVFLAVQFLSDILFFCVLQIILLVSLVEFYSLFDDTESPPYKILGLLIALLVSASFLLTAVSLGLALVCGLFFAASYSLLFLRKAKTLASFAVSMALTFMGPLLINFTVSHVFLLRQERGAFYIYFLIFIIICGDTAAYFIGKFWGSHQLAPKASPHKTWEGSLGGIAFAGVGGLCVQQFLIPDIVLWKAILVAFLVHFMAQIGDLLESLFKRSAGKKDSSSLLGGHGGFLDRVDSFVLAAPFFYYILKIFRLN
ncbi:MAG: phosphatidate cytidylyltransferase [Candidatus Aminicenantes bacterium]|jgi:phosphatidate cytidylyltransferase